MDHIPLAPAIRQERSQLLDRANLEMTLLTRRPSALGIARVTDAEISPTVAPTTAGSPTSAATPADAWCRSRTRRCSIRRVAAELERAVKDSCRGAGSRRSRTRFPRDTGTPTTTLPLRQGRRSSTCRSRSPDLRPVWSIPSASTASARRRVHYNVTLRQGVQQAWLTFLDYGTLERFHAAPRHPRVRHGLARPVPRRCDAVFETVSGTRFAAARRSRASCSRGSASSRGSRRDRERRSCSSTPEPICS